MTLYVTRPRRDEERIGRGLPSDSPLCPSELKNNSERTVWFSLYATSVIRELKEESLKENYF